MYIDTHCHLNFKAFEDDLLEVVKKSQEAGVEKIIVPGTDLETSKKAVEIAEDIEEVYAVVGFHPHHVKGLDRVDGKIKEELKKLAKSKKVVGIGECGLDYYVYQRTKYDKAEITTELKNLQKQLFGMQLQLAKELSLPMVIHNREAAEEILDVMNHFSKGDNKMPRGVFHCISGSKEYLEKILDLGFYIGVDGNVTYSKNVKKLAKKVPLNRLLLETDAPYLTPEPVRSEKINRGEKLRNEPISVKITAEYLADLKKVSLDKIIASTTKNAEDLFNI